MKRIFFLFCVLASVALAEVKPSDVKVGDSIIWTQAGQVYEAKVVQLSRGGKYFGVQFPYVPAKDIWVPVDSLKNLDITK